MATPDKIYVLLDERTGFLSHTFTNVPCGYENSQDIEYIRKDALIEWANSWLAFKRSGIVLDDGFSYAMEELIKKLNSM